MAQDWETPPAYVTQPAVWPPPPPGPPGPAAPSPQLAAAQALRPLNLGELLDRTFSVYRSRFWLFAGIGAISAALQALLGAVQLLPMHLAGRAGTLGRTAPPVGFPGQGAGTFPPNLLTGIGIGLGIVILVLSLVYMLTLVVTQAATVYALGEVYLGRPATIGGSIGATMRRWYRYLGIGIWQGFSMMWIPMVVVIGGFLLLATKNDGLMVLGGILIFLGIVGGLPGGFILYLRNSLAVQATVIESLTVRASMRRSKALTIGAKGRIFVMLLLAVALNYAAGLLQVPLLFFVMYTLAKGGQAIGSEIAMLLVSFVGRALVAPVVMIGLSLVYFDQRVRYEAFDLVMLLGQDSGPVGGLSVAPQPAVWPPPAPEPAGWPPPAPELSAPHPVAVESPAPQPTEAELPARPDDETPL